MFLKLLLGTNTIEQTVKALPVFVTDIFSFLLLKTRFILLSEDQKMRKHFDN